MKGREIRGRKMKGRKRREKKRIMNGERERR